MRAICLLTTLPCCGSKLLAQDPFEIHVYEYEPQTLGEYSLEAHLNLTAQGTAERDGIALQDLKRAIMGTIALHF